MRGAWAVAAVLVALSGQAARAQPRRPADRDEFTRRLVAAAVERASVKVTYVAGYRAIPYPGGDVPAGTGVCSDEIIRIYRALGIDLQKEVHEDMARAFAVYPRNWGAKKPDASIDHRRVPNLMTFFARHGEKRTVSRKGEDYAPGDLVSWDLNGRGLVHIGMVVDQKGPSGSYMILHNIGRGPVVEDALFNWTIIGHYRYFGPPKGA